MNFAPYCVHIGTNKGMKLEKQIIICSVNVKCVTLQGGRRIDN